jgi:hypothetical protein
MKPGAALLLLAAAAAAAPVAAAADEVDRRTFRGPRSCEKYLRRQHSGEIRRLAAAAPELRAVTRLSPLSRDSAGFGYSVVEDLTTRTPRMTIPHLRTSAYRCRGRTLDHVQREDGEGGFYMPAPLTIPGGGGG